MDAPDRAARCREVRPRHRAARPRRQGGWAAGPRAPRPVQRSCRRRTSRSGSTSRPSSPSGPAARPTSRRSRSRSAARPTSPPSRPSARSMAARSASTPTRAGRPTTRSRSSPALERLGVELIEQPFPARRLDQLRSLQERTSLPIVADESAVSIDDLDALVGVVAGVNVKLAKCGGVGPARRMLSASQRAGFPDVPRLHGGDVGRDRGVRGGGIAGGMGGPRRLTCCSPTTRSRGSSWTTPAGGGSPSPRPRRLSAGS